MDSPNTSYFDSFPWNWSKRETPCLFPANAAHRRIQRACMLITFLAQDHILPSTISHYTHARLPDVANPLHLLDKPLTRNLPPLSPPTGNSHRRVFIRHIKRVLQQPYVCCLQRLESLTHPTHQHFHPTGSHLDLSINTNGSNSRPSSRHLKTLSPPYSHLCPTRQQRRQISSPSPFPSPRYSTAHQPPAACPGPGRRDSGLEHGHRICRGRR